MNPDLTQEEIDINRRFIEAYEFLGFPNQRSGKTLFCNSINLNTATFSKVESNKRALPRHYLANMESTHGISALWLATGQGSMTVEKKGSGNTFHNPGTISGGQVHTGYGNQQAPQFTPAPIADNRVTALEEKIAGLERSLSDKDRIITEKEGTIQVLNRMITMLENQLSTKQ